MAASSPCKACRNLQQRQPLSTVGIINGKKYVRIHNDLDGGANLLVHCKSKDDDLGSHVLAQGQFYEFSFTPNWVGNTLFFCSFQFDGTCHRFDIYKDHRDYAYCGHCDWSVHRNGPCRHFNAPGHDCLPWNQQTC
ncbi:hypothetical protein AAHE18_04G176000 [Arachis hypogaea]